ncbi:hypothetical protein [Aeromicrobium sp.]|uniref:hypothetical protein n=1 Tax=Aeromicrobium sp. TaxID=1871063 RepID=UPI0019C439B8|nr:hypothetical protein [Aeromicrobium sp.]MBC7630742.1 hypothetical protein [Aeromicrobium sp.]
MTTQPATRRNPKSDRTIPANQCGRRIIRIRLDELEAAFRRLPPHAFERVLVDT